MSRKRKAQLAAAIAAAAIGTVAVVGLVTSAGAHVPATFTFPNGAKEVKSVTDGGLGNATQVIEVPGLGEATCTGVSYAGVPEGNPTTSIAVNPTFSGCEFLGQKFLLLRRQCRFVFNANGQLAISSEPGGDCVKVPMLLTTDNPSECSVTFPEQVLSGVTYTNEKPGSVDEVTAAMTLKGMKGERSEDCEAEGAFTNGEYKKGNTVLLGYEGATKKSMKWSATVP